MIYLLNNNKYTHEINKLKNSKTKHLPKYIYVILYAMP